MKSETLKNYPILFKSTQHLAASIFNIYIIFQVRSLCRDWFPIEYPQSWYEDITSSERFFALAAVYKAQIIGLIVAEIKPYLKLNAEDRGVLSRWFASKDTLVAYILSLGILCFPYF